MKYDTLKSSIKTVMEQRYELLEEGRLKWDNLCAWCGLWVVINPIPSPLSCFRDTLVTTFHSQGTTKMKCFLKVHVNLLHSKNSCIFFYRFLYGFFLSMKYYPICNSFFLMRNNTTYISSFHWSIYKLFSEWGFMEKADVFMTFAYTFLFEQC